VEKANSLRDNWLSYRVPFVIVLLVLTADQVTKLLVRENLAVGESIPQEGAIRLTHVTNSGIIFGIDVPTVVSLIVPLLVVIVALSLYSRYGPFDSWPMNVAVALFIGGSLGNLIDRLVSGHVTDFVDLRLWGGYHWPAFNLADAAILAGTLLFITLVLRLQLKRATKHD
jgi:signal peptidase II